MGLWGRAGESRADPSKLGNNSEKEISPCSPVVSELASGGLPSLIYGRIWGLSERWVCCTESDLAYRWNRSAVDSLHCIPAALRSPAACPLCSAPSATRSAGPLQSAHSDPASCVTQKHPPAV